MYVCLLMFMLKTFSDQVRYISNLLNIFEVIIFIKQNTYENSCNTMIL